MIISFSSIHTKSNLTIAEMKKKKKIQNGPHSKMALNFSFSDSSNVSSFNKKTKNKQFWMN